MGLFQRNASIYCERRKGGSLRVDILYNETTNDDTCSPLQMVNNASLNPRYLLVGKEVLLLYGKAI